MKIPIDYIEKAATADEIAVKDIFEKCLEAVSNKNAYLLELYCIPSAVFAIRKDSGEEEFMSLSDFIDRTSRARRNLQAISCFDTVVRIKNDREAAVTTFCQARIFDNLWPIIVGRQTIFSKTNDKWLISKLIYIG